jgi:hypothetical protein
MFKNPVISIIRSSVSTDISLLGYEKTSMVQCVVDFDAQTLQPEKSDEPPFKLSWFQLNTPEDYEAYSAFRVDWPYEGVRGFFFCFVLGCFSVCKRIF